MVIFFDSKFLDIAVARIFDTTKIHLELSNPKATLTK